MLISSNVSANTHGTYYQQGKSFSEDRWSYIIDIYDTITHDTGSCSIRQLARSASVSRNTAEKAIKFTHKGNIVYPNQGHLQRGVGVRKGLKSEHHAYLYRLYVRKPSRPRDAYVSKLRKRYGVQISVSTMSRWFKTMGPFKGNLRETSLFPPAKDSPRVKYLRTTYLRFICNIRNHKNLVFADEKPMKEQDIYSLVRRDIMTGIVPANKARNANSRNRWNIMCAVTVKKGVRSVEHLVFDECADSSLFSKFVHHLVEKGTLQFGDIFVIDNCTIHMQGVNKYLQESLFNTMGILMIPLPPYHPELNPTELVFNTLIQRLRSEESRSSSGSNIEFLHKVECEMLAFTRRDAKAFYRKCGYYR